MYKIRNWKDRFENSRTRTMANMRWSPIPNDFDGDGYTELITGTDGEVAYACWVLIIGVASKCDPRGSLVRKNGKPHDAHSLSRITRASVKSFQKSIPKLISIGWLEEYQEPITDVIGTCQEPVTEGRKEGIEEKEGITPKARTCQDDFKKAWKQLPKPFPQVAKWTDKRNKTLAARLEDEFFKDNWRAGLEKMQRIPFYRGENDRGWVGNIDSFLRPDALVKIIEYQQGNGNGTGKRSADDAILEKMKREGFNV